MTPPTRPSLPPELRSEEVLTAIASLRAAVIDDNTLAEWFRPGYLLEVAKLLAALDAALLPYVQDAERYRFLRGNPLVLDMINGAAIGTLSFDRMTDEALTERRFPDTRRATTPAETPAHER